MANNIIAPLSKHKKGTLILIMVALVGFGAWCYEDGYLDKSFIEENTEDGKPNGTLIFNQKAPPYLLGGAFLICVYWLLIRKRQVLASEEALVINHRIHIPYDSIQQIDKTYFEKKGYFIMTYKDTDGKERKYKLCDRDYDNLVSILDHLVKQIT